MTYVITQACIGVKDASCLDVCPVDCIHEIEDMYVIDPGECIDCAACVWECPVDAIYSDDQVPPELGHFQELNRRAVAERVTGT